MSSVNNNNNIYNAIFANSAYQSNNTGGMSWLFGGGTSNILADYSLIKTGAYKKLLNAYYATDKEDSTSSSSSTSKSEDRTHSVASKTLTGDSTSALVTIKNEAKALSGAAKALSDKSLYEATGVDENGKDTYDRDGIEKAVKKFVSNYNSYLNTAGNMNGQSILGKTVNMTQTASYSAQTLKEAGITINGDNTLSVDTEKLKSAKMSTLVSLFTGKGSFGQSIENMSQSVYKIANSTAYTNTYASSYSNKGSYSLLGKSNDVFDQFL